MRILFLSDNFVPETNAAATRVHERAVYWAKWGHQVTVLTSAPNFPEGRLFAGYRNHWYRRESIDGITVIRVKTFIAANDGIVLRSLDFLSFMASAAIAGLFQQRPDVVVATSPQFFTAVAGWVLELGDLWPRSIVAVGAIRVGWIIRLLEHIEMFLYRRAAAIVALTHAFKENLVARGIPGDKIVVIRNGVDLQRYSPRRRDTAQAIAFGLADRFVIGYVGTHGLAHDLGNILAAAEMLRDKPIAFLFVGAGAERETLMADAARRQLPNVEFLPMQPKDAMTGIWSLCDVALVHLKDAPAFSEVIPSKMFEAMAMGLPIILASPAGEASRILGGDGAGLWVPAGNPAALAEAASALFADCERCAGFAARSLAASRQHTREHQAASFIAALQAAVRPGG
jgi:colanic acid biosynthesis glycosyl transferase WcaI